MNRVPPRGERPVRRAASSATSAQIRLIVPILVVEELDDLLHDRRGAH
jgi:hypothetical protein